VILDRFFKFNQQDWSNNNFFSTDRIQELENDNLLSLSKKKQILLNGLDFLKKTKNIKNYITCCLILSDIYLKENETHKMGKIFYEVEELINENHLKFHEFYKSYRTYLMNEGELEEARKLVLKYIEVLKKNKKYRQVSLFLSEIEEEIKFDRLFYQHWLESLGKEGDLNSFNEVYSKYRKKFGEIGFKLDSWYIELQKLWEEKKIQWEVHGEIYKNKLILTLEEKIKNNLELSRFLNLYHGLLILHNVEESFTNYIDDVINGYFQKAGIYEKAVDKLDFFKNEASLEKFITYKRPPKKINFVLNNLLDEEKLLLKFLKKKNEKFFLKNFKEWFICFIFMEAYLICDYLIQVYERNQDFKRIDKKTFIDIEYLKVELFLKRNRPKLALSRCELILRSIPLIKKERISFLYLMAEAYKNLNIKNKSVEFYKAVSGLNPNYRLVQERLIEFE
tara:strand:- start:4490 stop:5839 length:1350 start_codon:yes stop_codon:yes gene_type:complete